MIDGRSTRVNSDVRCVGGYSPERRSCRGLDGEGVLLGDGDMKMRRRKFLTLGSAALMTPFVSVSPTVTKMVPPLSISTSGLTETGGVLTREIFDRTLAKFTEIRSTRGQYDRFSYYRMPEEKK